MGNKNGNRVFSGKIADTAITAVCCEEQDDVDNPIFYASDAEGSLYTVNKKGLVVATAKVPKRKGEIHIISNRSKYSIYAYTSSGTTSFSHATSDFRKGTGDYDVIQFDGRTPSRVVASVAIEFGPKLRNYEQVFVYAVVHTDYENLIEEGTAENSLRVMNSSGKDIRTMEFKSPVKQVMSCRHHEGSAEEDKIFIMLWNGNLYSVTGTMLSDESVANEALDLKLAVDIKTLATQTSTGAPAEDSDSDDDDDFGE